MLWEASGTRLSPLLRPSFPSFKAVNSFGKPRGRVCPLSSGRPFLLLKEIKGFVLGSLGDASVPPPPAVRSFLTKQVALGSLGDASVPPSPAVCSFLTKQLKTLGHLGDASVPPPPAVRSFLTKQLKTLGSLGTRLSRPLRPSVLSLLWAVSGTRLSPLLRPSVPSLQKQLKALESRGDASVPPPLTVRSFLTKSN